MKIIAIIINLVVSALILSLLILSGLYQILDIDYRLLFLVIVGIVYGVYKLRYKYTPMITALCFTRVPHNYEIMTYKPSFILKTYLLRSYIRANKYLKKIETKITQTDEYASSPIQDKVIRLWKLSLKDKRSQITCSILNKKRQIEKGDKIMILTPLGELDYLMTVMDVGDSKSCLYEVRINSKISETVTSLFDTENERRMTEGENIKRNAILSDLDKLLLEAENSLIPAIV